MILIAYATKHGSTREVAEAVAGTLREEGLEVEVKPAAEARALEAYDGVVLGGALYMGRLHKDAKRFLSRHRGALAALPVAVFAMGPRTLEEQEVAESRAQLDRALADVPELEPVAVTIFGGVLDPAAQHFPFNRMPAADARDWDAIRLWARELARSLAVPA
ncbi:MAG TPA: flavodoxin domain-containing protein [Gaiellaceae bacterium]